MQCLHYIHKSPVKLKLNLNKSARLPYTFTAHAYDRLAGYSIYSFSSQFQIVHFRNLIFSQCKIGLFLFTFHAFGPHPSNSTFGTLSVHGVTCPDTVFRTGVSTSDTVLSFRTYHIYKKIRETLIRCFLGANLCITVYTILLHRF